MADLNEEVKVEGVYGNTASSAESSVTSTEANNVMPTSTGSNLPVKTGFWTNMKNFWLQDISWNTKIDWKREFKVELTPYQQKIEDEINEFLHQEISFKGLWKILKS